MKKCKTCSKENYDGASYCQFCGSKLPKKPIISIGKRNTASSLAGTGTRGSSLAPLGMMSIENSAKELGEVTVVSNLIKIQPLQDGSWYCPDCGELNHSFTFSCKGCGRDFT